MKIKLKGEHLERYRELRRRRCGMTTAPRKMERIRICHLTPRQRKKLAEMMLEGEED